MARFAKLVEEVRDAIDDEGVKGCYSRAVERYSKESGIPAVGLWAAVDGVLRNNRLPKMIKFLVKSYGGSPNQWLHWFEIVRQRPGCKAVR